MLCYFLRRVDRLPSPFVSLELSFGDDSEVPQLAFGISFAQQKCTKNLNSFLTNVTNSCLQYICLPYIQQKRAKVTHLSFGVTFNQSVDHLPPTITHLTFGNDFNQSVDFLPESITHLTFGSHFNKPVDHLPQKLIFLKFGKNFSQKVDSLPSSLTTLIFGERFNHPIDCLPENVTVLAFGSIHNQFIEIVPARSIKVSFGIYCDRIVGPAKKIEFDASKKLIISL